MVHYHLVIAESKKEVSVGNEAGNYLLYNHPENKDVVKKNAEIQLASFRNDLESRFFEVYIKP